MSRRSAALRNLNKSLMSTRFVHNPLVPLFISSVPPKQDTIKNVLGYLEYEQEDGHEGIHQMIISFITPSSWLRISVTIRNYNQREGTRTWCLPFKWHSLVTHPLIKHVSENRPLILFNNQNPLGLGLGCVPNHQIRVILAWPIIQVNECTTHNQLIIILFGRSSPHPKIYFCRPPSQRAATAAATIEEEDQGNTVAVFICANSTRTCCH